MRLIIVLFGLAIAGTGLLMFARSGSLLGFLERNAGSAYIQQLAIGVRLVLGIVLIEYAEHSRFPLALTILGGVSITAAVFIAVLPQQRFERIVRWAVARFRDYAKPASALVVLFGLFLVVAVV